MTATSKRTERGRSKPHVRPRMPLPDRRQQLLDIALSMCQVRQYQTITVGQLARLANCDRVVVYRAITGIGRMTELPQTTLSRAIEEHALAQCPPTAASERVIDQMAAMGDPRALARQANRDRQGALA